MPTLLKRTSHLVWDGLTLRDCVVLTGTDLEPQWALVRIRRVLEEAKATVTARPGDSSLEFDKCLLAISMTAAYLPYEIRGEVRAERAQDGLVVTATTSIGTLIGGLALSAVGITLFLGFAGMPAWSQAFWWLLGIATAATAFHVWQAAHFLQRVTDAATTLKGVRPNVRLQVMAPVVCGRIPLPRVQLEEIVRITVGE